MGVNRNTLASSPRCKTRNRNQSQECKRLLLECRRRLEVVPRAEVRKTQQQAPYILDYRTLWRS